MGVGVLVCVAVEVGLAVGVLVGVTVSVGNGFGTVPSGVDAGSGADVQEINRSNEIKIVHVLRFILSTLL